MAPDHLVPNGGAWVVDVGEELMGMLEVTVGYVEREELGEDVILVRECVKDYLGVDLKEIVYAVAALQ